MGNELPLNGTNTKPGHFSDGTSVSNLLDKFRNEEAQANQDAEKLISDSFEQHLIPTEFADFLRTIKASTMAMEGARLSKIGIALDCYGIEGLAELKSGSVVYSGSGFDWEFPVALGAREIDMVDLDFLNGNGSTRTRIIESVKKADPEAIIGENSDIKLKVNLGKGLEEVKLRLIGAEAAQYIPERPIKGVLDYNSPRDKESKLIRENLLQHLYSGSIILNFDYGNNQQLPEGVTQLHSRRGYIGKIDDIEAVKVWQSKQIPKKGINIDEIRKTVRERQSEI